MRQCYCQTEFVDFCLIGTTLIRSDSEVAREIENIDYVVQLYPEP